MTVFRERPKSIHSSQNSRTGGIWPPTQTGVYAIVSNDGGRTWDEDRPIQLALSALNEVGWPVTLQLDDGSLLTAYALTAYLKQPRDMFVTETVRWQLP